MEEGGIFGEALKWLERSEHSGYWVLFLAFWVVFFSFIMRKRLF